MRPTRKIIADFVGVFVIGGMAGGFVSWGYINWYYDETHITGFMSRTSDPDVLMARINKKYSEQYHLTPDEMSRIQPLVKEMSQSIYKVRHQFGEDVLSTLDNYHQQIAAQLTPEHREAYLTAMGERKKSLSAMLLVPDQSSPTQGQK